MDRKLKKYLEEYTVPPYDEMKQKRTFLLAEQQKARSRGGRMSGWKFFFDQIRFIRKRTWIIKAAATILFLFYIERSNTQPDNSLLLLGAVGMPLLCLVNARELWALCQPGLLELQMTVRNPLRHVLLVRLTAFGAADLLLLFTAAILFSALDSGEIWQILLYGTVPYFAMCAGCTAILKRWDKENGMLFCSAWAILLSVLLLCVENTGGEIYCTQYVWVWMFAEVIAAAGMVKQIADLLKQSGGNRNEINAGKAV